MNRILCIIGLSMTLISCQPEGRIFEEHQELSPDLEWLKKDVPEFKVLIDDTSRAYDLHIAFRYATGYQYQVLKVKMIETSPSGKELETSHELKIREDNGEYIGEPGFDIWDSNHLIQPNKSFEETGIFTYTIEQDMPVDVLNYGMEIGLIIDRVE